MTDLEAQSEASFAVELASNAALRAIVEKHGREPAYTAWRLGWFCGALVGLQNAKEIFSEGMR